VHFVLVKEQKAELLLALAAPPRDS